MVETHRQYYPSGQLASEVTTIDGVPEGTWYWYHENGHMEAMVRYHNGLVNGSWCEWHPNGAVKMDQLMMNSKLVRAFIVYHDNGQRASRISVDGVETERWDRMGNALAVPAHCSICCDALSRCASIAA